MESNAQRGVKAMEFKCPASSPRHRLTTIPYLRQAHASSLRSTSTASRCTTREGKGKNLSFEAVLLLTLALPFFSLDAGGTISRSLYTSERVGLPLLGGWTTLRERRSAPLMGVAESCPLEGLLSGETTGVRVCEEGCRWWPPVP
ncbi:hypothetical protein BDZ90DRAFT_38828 [Jaminaea rosea]|uniref:Uncharacterized protein n=1 Tax=Jaminaea rosea TaxID=1569628 RepID=A0A316UNS6_9BASI|nr:hypothetical protein BDZ90DRAFT_38828 [Jaminaea rosea]PWN26428.1 hypothetical protein BDZ90DRAFT_38828 [Jaminaea rosea]